MIVSLWLKQKYYFLHTYPPHVGLTLGDCGSQERTEKSAAKQSFSVGDPKRWWEGSKEVGYTNPNPSLAFVLSYKGPPMMMWGMMYYIYGWLYTIHFLCMSRKLYSDSGDKTET